MFSIGAFAIIFDDQERVLLCHRRDFDVWNLPGGGVESGELPTEAAIRETREETGLDVVVERLVGVSSHLVGRTVVKVLGDQKIVAIFDHPTLALHPPLPVGIGFGGTGRTHRMNPTGPIGPRSIGAFAFEVDLVAKQALHSPARRVMHTVGVRHEVVQVAVVTAVSSGTHGDTAEHNPVFCDRYPTRTCVAGNGGV